MNNFSRTNFSRTYNPSGRQNVLSDIKRLLTSRDTEAQNKACGYLIEVIGRNKNKAEGSRLVEYLLDNDITVFLCEATSNLDFSLFRSVLTCLRLLWRDRRFFADEHSAQAMTSVLRALAHYSGSGLHTAVDACLCFLSDLLTGISTYNTTSPLSHQSAYSAIQLLACLNSLAPRINTIPNTILSSALVLHSLLSYQPEDLVVKGNTATALADILSQWFTLLLGALNHTTLVGDGAQSGMFLVVICHLGMDSLRLSKLLQHGKEKHKNFVQTIMTDDQELALLRQSALELTKTIQRVMADLVSFTKDNETEIPTEEYSVFLKFLLLFLYDHQNTEALPDFCDVLFSKGYLTMLPQAQLIRKDMNVRKVSTLVLGEMLKVLSETHLRIENSGGDHGTCARDIHMGLVELQNGIERPHSIGAQLQKHQPYSLLIYIYFCCQSSENPEEATAPLLPYLVEHLLCLPKSFQPPPYIIKALWLVFAMSTISNGGLKTLEERVYLEKATDRFIKMLYPEPSVYYTHNPAILLWAFTSSRIPNSLRLQVLSQWLKSGDSLPEDMTAEPAVWDLLLTILIQNKDGKTVNNCMKVLQDCLEETDEDSEQAFGERVWSALPGVLSKALIDDYQIEINICYLLELAIMLLPDQLDQTICLKVAVLITTIFSKNMDSVHDIASRQHYEQVSLKLCLYLLGKSNDQNDNKVLLICMNRPGFLASVLAATNSSEEGVACAALQLLSYVVYYFNKNQYQMTSSAEIPVSGAELLIRCTQSHINQYRATNLSAVYGPRRRLYYAHSFDPKSVLEIQTNLVIKSLQRESSTERGAALLQFVYMVLNSGWKSPLVLGPAVEGGEWGQGTALRALMLRIQLMLCCRDSKNQTQAGWKTLGSVFKHAIVAKNNTKLIALLTSQPWTHTLVQFQLTQGITEEFLTFVQNWLSFLKVTIIESLERKRHQFSRHSLLIKTLMLLKKNLLMNEESKEMKEKVLNVAFDLLDVTGVRINI